MKLKTNTDKFGVTTIKCKAKSKESFDSFAASMFSLGKKWFLSFKYEAKKKVTILKFSANNLISLEDFLQYALLRDQFAMLLKSLSDFLTYMREHSVQNEYVLFDTKYVLLNKEDLQLKFLYLPFKTPEMPPKSLYDFLVEIGGKVKFANAAQDEYLLERYRSFFVLRELFSVTKFKDMVESIYKETFLEDEDDEKMSTKTADLNLDAYEILEARKDVFVESAIKVDDARCNRSSSTTCALYRKSIREQLVCHAYPCVFGSGQKADVVISGSPAISRCHAQIDFEGGVFAICDLGSTNGTHLNGQKLNAGEPVTINHGDKVLLANEAFVFEVVG